MKWRPETVTGALYVLPIVAIMPFWYIITFVGNVPNPNYGEMFHTWFSEGPYQELFWYHAVLPVICAIFAVAYLTAITRYTTMARVMFGAGVVLAISAWFMSNLGIAIFVTIPLMYGVKAAWHLTNRWSGP